MHARELAIYKIDVDKKGSLAYDSIRELIFFHYHGRLFSEDGHAPFFIQTTEVVGDIYKKISLESPALYERISSIKIQPIKSYGQESNLSSAAEAWLVTRFRTRDLLFCFQRAS